MIIVQVHDDRAERQSLPAVPVRTPSHGVLQAVEQPVQLVGPRRSGVGRQTVHPVVRHAKRARPPVTIEVVAERLLAAPPHPFANRPGKLPFPVIPWLDHGHPGAGLLAAGLRLGGNPLLEDFVNQEQIGQQGADVNRRIQVVDEL